MSFLLAVALGVAGPAETPAIGRYDQATLDRSAREGVPLVTFVGCPPVRVAGCLVAAEKGLGEFKAGDVVVSVFVGGRHRGRVLTDRSLLTKPAALAAFAERIKLDAAAPPPTAPYYGPLGGEPFGGPYRPPFPPLFGRPLLGGCGPSR